MEQIKKIVKDNDIAAFVVLHDSEGFSEYLNAISPSYSCAGIEDGKVSVRLKQSEVGLHEARRIAHSTFNMFTHFTDMVGKHALMFMETQKFLKEKWNGSEDRGGETSHTEQNN